MSIIIADKNIMQAVGELVRAANLVLPEDVLSALEAAAAEETSSAGRSALSVLIRNAAVAAESGLPLCQDTGIDTVFIEMGQKVSIKGDLVEAVNRGIAEGTRRGYLRASVCDPITRKNTGDNTPAVVHVELVPGDEFRITLLPKGCGSENMSGLFMLPPSVGLDGVIRAVVERVGAAGPNPCPPGIIGIGIGGTMEKAALLSKKALLRTIGSRNPREDVAALEGRLLENLNRLGIGPLGLGGRTTTLAVAVEVFPCHIASLPVAINVQCHAARRKCARWVHGSWRYEGTFSAPDITPPAEALVPFADAIRIDLPLSKEAAAKLRAGDRVLLTGTVFTARDQTHSRLVEMLDRGEPLPVNLKGQLLYYVGPSPPPPGRPTGSAGPTTSYRMDSYTPRLLEEGVIATMGKGRRSKEVREALRAHGAVYLATVGGAGAYLAGCIKSCETAAFPELGPEALYRMEVEDFPAVVINDVTGADYYDEVLSG